MRQSITNVVNTQKKQRLSHIQIRFKGAICKKSRFLCVLPTREQTQKSTFLTNLIQVLEKKTNAAYYDLYLHFLLAGDL